MLPTQAQLCLQSSVHIYELENWIYFIDQSNLHGDIKIIETLTKYSSNCTFWWRWNHITKEIFLFTLVGEMTPKSELLLAWVSHFLARLGTWARRLCPWPYYLASGVIGHCPHFSPFHRCRNCRCVQSGREEDDFPGGLGLWGGPVLLCPAHLLLQGLSHTITLAQVVPSSASNCCGAKHWQDCTLPLTSHRQATPCCPELLQALQCLHTRKASGKDSGIWQLDIFYSLSGNLGSPQISIWNSSFQTSSFSVDRSFY